MLKKPMEKRTKKTTTQSGNLVPNEHSKPATAQTPLLDYMAMLIEQFGAVNRFGAVQNYQKAMCSIARFLQTESDTPLAAINEEWVGRYDAFLIHNGLVRNSRSFYMRTLRAVYNRAVRQKLIPQTYPFVEVYTGVDKTRKRAIKEEVIKQLYELSLPEESPLALSRDLFLFSYFSRGMAFVDIAYLTKSNLQGGTICYSRHKTGQLLCVRVEPCIQRILDRYTSRHSPYLFPLLSSTDAVEAYREYGRALNVYNRNLGILSRMLNCGCKLTSYTPRHSWATAARDHNVPISVISAGMGHTSELTTRIYLTSLDNSIIDTANREILSWLE